MSKLLRMDWRKIIRLQKRSDRANPLNCIRLKCINCFVECTWMRFSFTQNREPHKFYMQLRQFKINGKRIWRTRMKPEKQQRKSFKVFFRLSIPHCGVEREQRSFKIRCRNVNENLLHLWNRDMHTGNRSPCVNDDMLLFGYSNEHTHTHKGAKLCLRRCSARHFFY